MGLFSKFFNQRSKSRAGKGWQNAIDFRGAWHLGSKLSQDDENRFYSVFTCVSKISQDISKLSLLTKVFDNNVWLNKRVKDFDFLSKPNHYQTTHQFFERWMLSKLLYGNTYVLKQRDVYGQVKHLYVLQPENVQVLVSQNGDVFYRISYDKLNGINEASIVLPASEIIHDRFNCLHHPLIGLSPIVACSVAIDNGLAIQKNSSVFFNNQARPAGILTAPEFISEEAAKEIKKRWMAAYSGDNYGHTAVLGNGLTYQPITITATDSQLIEQLQMSASIVCSVFKVPPFLIGLSTLPQGMKIEDINEIYYSGCLQSLIEAIENHLTYEIVNNENVIVEFDLDSLIRMNSTALMSMLKTGVSSALLTPNEGRQRLGLAPVHGGDTPYLQQQNYSLTALAKRDANKKPFSK